MGGVSPADANVRIFTASELDSLWVLIHLRQ